jgi:RNA polymerase sigma-B factor
MTTADRSMSEPKIPASSSGSSGSSGSGVDPRFAELRATGDRRVRNALVEDHRWLAQHCVRRFTRKGEPAEDLEQVATVGLLKAVDRFDPGLGYTFATYAVPTIMGELRRHFRDRTWSMRVPRRPKENYLAVKAAADELHQALGRSPTIHELAEWASLSVEDTLEALQVGDSYRGVPFDEPGDNDGAADHTSQLGATDPGYAAAEAHLVIPGLLAVLPGDRERRIVVLRFVHDMSQSQIATELGISQVHVSRLLRTSLHMMRSHLEK